MSRKNLTISLSLVVDASLSPTAKVIYLVLKSFQKGKADNLPAASIIVTHRQIIERSGFSHTTVVKALNNLESAGWVRRRRNSGSANKYIFTTPAADADGIASFY